ncbi:MAG TPA: hypothetical protein VNH11_35920 [Pirellulales bacterium]|nr:hypothetical protein [Pirellulales bacterium]
MPSISSCPECHRDLTIPDLADRQQPLRCPLCDAQFSADRVLADSVNFPPAAIVVGDRSPLAPQAEGRREPGDSPVGESSGLESTSAHGVSGLGAPQAERGGELGDSPEPQAEGPGEPGDFPVGEPSELESTSAHGVSGLPNDYEAFGQQAASMRVAPKVRRKSSPLGVLGQLVGMALGGVVGLAIGYYVLVWMGGPRADFLELRGKLPHWLRPPVRRHNDAGDSLPLTHQPPQAVEPPAPRERRPGNDDPIDDAPPVTPSSGDLVGLATAEQGPYATRHESSRAGPSPPSHDEPIERLPPTAKPLPDDYRGPRGFRLRSVAELQTALDRAEHALRCPHCLQPGAVQLAAFTAVDDAGGQPPEAERPPPLHCDYCRGKPVLNLTTGTYERLCDLAEMVTFARFDGDDASRERCRDAAVTLLLAIGSQRDKSDVVGRLSGARLDDSQRQSNGILLSGTVQQTKAEGDLFEIQLMLAGCGKVVTVVSRQSPDPPLARRDRLLVLGSIVDGPRDNLAGYVGELPQVVWGGLPLRLAAPPR